ncbi:hypothetical protein J1614_003096 [Plenodomus biglobosus]|nr:hypothetical protein J1614_003096 [Plenodomus biglobosus]
MIWHSVGATGANKRLCCLVPTGRPAVAALKRLGMAVKKAEIKLAKTYPSTRTYYHCTFCAFKSQLKFQP